MSQQDVVSDSEYVGFSDLLKRSELEQVLLRYKDSDQYDAILRYYEGCIDAQDDLSLQSPLALLEEALGSLAQPIRRRRDTEELPLPGTEATGMVALHEKIKDYGARVSHGAALLKSAIPQVPKKLHFVWLGGGVGEIQRDYINVWKQVMTKDGHKLFMWYDSDALLAYETNRIIVQAAKADAMAGGGAELANPVDLGHVYIEHLIPLKEQLYTHLLRAQARGESADEARINLLVRGYGLDETALRALREKHVRSMTALVSTGLVLCDLQRLEAPLRVEDIYQREINLRGNFAGASDVVRAEVLSAEGGSYSDVDNLPPLTEKLGSVDISAFSEDARLGVLQLLLDHNPEWMPGRQNAAGRYKKYFDSIPQDQRAALEAFAKSRPVLNDVFHVPEKLQVRLEGLRAVSVRDTVNNSFLMAHSGSAMLNAVIDRFLLNYEVVKTTARKAVEQNISHSDMQAMDKLAMATVAEYFGTLNELPAEDEIALRWMAKGAAEYYNDGIYPDSQLTVHLTGPDAMLAGIGDYEKSNLTPRTAGELRQLVAIRGNGTVNRQTEEEQDHSWKEQAPSEAQWLIDEKNHWREGRFQARYKGDFTQLLKRQTIEFESGWPLIEGRHVLSTTILQRLLDHLGEPFLKAMSEGRNDSVTFDKLLPLSFDDRQAIIAQDLRAFAPAVDSDATTQSLSIIEVLARLAARTLRVEQLSAAQRLLLGQLLGLKSLDNRSFDAVAGELGNLATKVSHQGLAGRYALIEEQLFKHRAADFIGGLNSPAEGPLARNETALALKKTAMEKTLSLRQWGQQVARIQHVAKAEFRDRLLERSGELLGSFSEGAARFVPQDLLFDGFGDTVGRRCYPLVLAMSAAITQGEAAVNTLRERFYVSVLAPEDSDSRTFVHAIEALHGVQESEIGVPLARSSLRQVVDLLEARTTTSTLMLNSDNHAMLVAKTWVGERSTYHFYDPNLGIFEFEQPEGMHSDLRKFFEQKGMADYYGAFGSATRPTFDLVELQGGRVAQLALSSGVKVADVLLPGELKGAGASGGRQRLASARGHSLVDNSRLGKSLMELDHHWWAQQIKEATGALLVKNSLAGEFSPLFETLEITSTGDYQISLIKPEKAGVAEQLIRVSTLDQRFLRIKEHLTELFGKLTVRRVNELEPFSAGAVHTLNAGFAVQALMNALRSQEGDARNLSLAVRLHAYVNYAQLLHGMVVDFVGVVNLVRQGLAQERLMAQTSSTVAGEALGHVATEGVATLLGMANVGFDIYQLDKAEDDVQVARFGTQLAFDGASTVLGAAALGAGLASASAVATVLGGLSVIVGGLAVGIAALAEGFALIAQRAKQVGLFFDELDQAYRGDAFSWDEYRKEWRPHPKLVITRLDLREGCVVYDSQRLFPLRDHLGVPDFDVDYERAINIRQGLGLPGSSGFLPADAKVIVLPCTPQTFYGYDYQLLPYATWRHDKGFDIARRLEKKNSNGDWQFLFTFYSFPGDYVVKSINPAYRPGTVTVIQVKLDDAPRLLVVQQLPGSWHGKIAYEIEGGEAPCTLLLNPGVNLELKALGMRTMQWVLLATWATESDVQFVRGEGLKIGAVSIKYSGTAGVDVMLQLNGNNRYRVDHHLQKLIGLEQDAVPGLDAQALRGHFMTLAREHRLELPYTPVHQFLIPFEAPAQPRHCTAYYDSAEDRFLYIRDDDVIVPEDPQLGAVVDGAAYFFHPQSAEVLKVDTVTGLISHRYRLMLKVGDSTVTQCEAVPGGGVRVVQHITESSQTDVLVYLITDEGVFLSSLTRQLDTSLEQVLGEGPTLTDWRQVFGIYIDWPKVVSQERFETSVWQLASFVSIHWKPEDNFNDMTWVRSSDRLIIRPMPSRHHARGWPDSEADLNQLSLLAPGGNEGELFVIYTGKSDRLCVRRRSLVKGQLQLSVEWQTLEGLTNVIAMQEGCVALTKDGLFFNFTEQGPLQLGGMTQIWFNDRPQWWTQLPALVAGDPGASLTLLGLDNFSGEARLCAWYIDGRLLLADVGHRTEIRLLGITPDNAAAWLYDVSSGVVYRQVFIDPGRLEAAFGSGARLLQVDALPDHQPQWNPWSFAGIKRDGAGLRATTEDGIEMALNHQEPALITGVDRQWVRTHADALSDNLKALVDSYHHCASLLTVAQPDRKQWYVSETGRLIETAPGLINEPFSVLGTQRQTNVLLHEETDALLHTYPRAGTAGPLNYVRREGDVLTVEPRANLDDLEPLLPDDVRTLVLRLGPGDVTCRLSQAAWLRLDSVIVDCRPSLSERPVVPGKLIWALEKVDKLVATLVDEHLVILDPDTSHSLIFRQVLANDVALRGDVYLAVAGSPSVAVSKLVSALVARPSAMNGALLNALLATTGPAETTPTLV